MTASLRSRQIIAARMRSARESFEMAFAELDGAIHDAKTSGIDIDPYDAFDLGREPDDALNELRLMEERVWTG